MRLLLRKFAPDATGGYAEGRSPMQLTEKGKRFVERNGVEKMIEGAWLGLSSEIEKRVQNSRLKTPYELQEICFDVAGLFEDFMQRKDIERLHDLAYAKDLDVAAYRFVLGVLVRDKYFTERGVQVGKLDRDEPKKSHKKP